MSKAAGRNRHPKKQPAAHEQKTSPAAKGDKKRAAALVIIVVLAAIPFILGKYMELNTPGAYDSGAYTYSARHILEGAKIGIDERPSAQMGTLLANILGVWLFGFSDVGPKIIQGLLQAAALVWMFAAVSRLFGRLAAAISVIITSSYLSTPLIAKYGNVKEQYMIAFMVMGISSFVLYQLNGIGQRDKAALGPAGGKWWQCLLAGAFLSWAPLFKQTGTSAIGAVGLFVILQPLLKHRTLKQTGIDILLLLAGAAIALAPLYIWIIGWDVKMSLPYAFAWKIPARMIASAGPAAGQPEPPSSYIDTSRELVSFAQQWPRVLRYYQMLLLPIALATASILTRFVRMIMSGIGKLRPENKKSYEGFVLLFSVWWLLDMAFVWISPRSYEQYYLPLNASAAMLGGYVIGLYNDRLTGTAHKARWIAVGVLALVCMAAMSGHIFFGIKKSPHTGVYYGQRRRGYAQRLREISLRKNKGYKGAWEVVGQYIREHSQPSDKIYVWGWVPGIYVKAQRLSPTSKAFAMPRPAPQILAKTIAEMMKDFKRQPPKFIVDTRKRHIPMDRPPYELWPIAPKGFMHLQKAGFLPLNQETITLYDAWWTGFLRKHFGDDEAERYKILAPFRKFVMENYELAEPGGFMNTGDGRRLVHSAFGDHIVFRLKDSTVGKEQE